MLFSFYFSVQLIFTIKLAASIEVLLRLVFSLLSLPTLCQAVWMLRLIPGRLQLPSFRKLCWFIFCFLAHWLRYSVNFARIRSCYSWSVWYHGVLSLLGHDLDRSYPWMSCLLSLYPCLLLGILFSIFFCTFQCLHKNGICTKWDLIGRY